MNALFPYQAKSAAQTFEEEGILFYPRLFEGEELARLRAACEGVLQQFLTDVDCRETGDKNTHLMRHLNDIRWHTAGDADRRLLLETVADPRCLGPVEQVFRGESLFRSTSLFFNPRFESMEGDWHRDIQFLVKDEDEVRDHIANVPVIGIQLQIALVDNDDVEYVPFSARRYDSPEEFYFRCADGRRHNRESGMPNAVRVTQRAGDAIIFNPNGLHRGRYHMDNPRRTLMLTYTPRQMPFFDYFSQQPWMLAEGYTAGLSERARAYINSFIGVYRDSWRDAA